MAKRFKAFLSCSFSEDDLSLNNFFKTLVDSLGFETLIYDFQEPITVPRGIKEKIQSCDCLIALVTRRLKIEGTNDFMCPPWLTTEMTWADSFKKPIAIFVENGVSLRGFPQFERYESFDRSDLLIHIPKITKYLQGIRDFLIERDISSSIPLPILIRNSAESVLEILSEEECNYGRQISMTSLSKELASCHHTSFFAIKRPDSTPKGKQFTFSVIEKPNHVEIEQVDGKIEDDFFTWKIQFTPPLNEGERVTYYYNCLMHNCHPYTFEEAQKASESLSYPLSEPLCFHLSTIVYPTEKLRMKVRFPEKYPVKLARVSVEIGNSGNVSQAEIDRLKDINALRVKRLMDRTEIYLDVEKPYLGYKYIILWQPPKKEKLLNS